MHETTAQYIVVEKFDGDVIVLPTIFTSVENVVEGIIESLGFDDLFDDECDNADADAEIKEAASQVDTTGDYFEISVYDSVYCVRKVTGTK